MFWGWRCGWGFGYFWVVMVQQCFEGRVDDIDVVATAKGVEPVDSDALQ